jgi:aminopeptidase
VESRFAELLTDYCLEATPGQTILIQAQTPAQPLLEALIPTLFERGAFPLLWLSLPGQERVTLLKGGAWLDRPPAALEAIFEQVTSSLRILSEENPLELSELDPSLMARRQQGWRGLQHKLLQRRWSLTLYPTPGYAQLAGLSTEAFRRFVEQALFLDHDDPLKAWRELHAVQEELIGRLQRAKEVHIEAPGTDLRLRVEGRTWINSDGKRNMPSGEVFTGPQENSAQGVIRFNLPVVSAGQRLEGIELRFQEGKVTGMRAERGEAYLAELLALDSGASYLGELGIGTNFGIQRPSGLILFDEKIGGSLHLALGNSYPETGGTNRSALHLDLILDLRPGGRVKLDGEVFLDDGRFR